MRWSKGSTEGRIIIGESGRGNELNRLYNPTSITIDRQGNLYVVDSGNHRILKFDVILD